MGSVYPYRPCRRGKGSRSGNASRQDDQDKVWLSYTSSEYGAKMIHPRHGLAVTDEAAKGPEKFLAEASDQSTQ